MWWPVNVSTSTTWLKAVPCHGILTDFNTWCFMACVSANPGFGGQIILKNNSNWNQLLQFFWKEVKSCKRLHDALVCWRWFLCILIKECYWRRIQILQLLLLFVLSVLVLWGDNPFQYVGLLAKDIFWHWVFFLKKTAGNYEMVIRERDMKDFEYISTKTWITSLLFLCILCLNTNIKCNPVIYAVSLCCFFLILRKMDI